MRSYMSNFLVLCFSILVISCKKDEPIQSQTTETKPALEIVFEASVNSEELVPNTKWYTNFSNDSFTVSKFNYYISNLRLKNADGTYYKVPESYHLIQHVEGINKISLKDLPEGDFVEIDFLIGVDSLRNVSGSQNGDLDPAKNMFWDWNTGYIFFKLEGLYNTLTQTLKTDYAIHIGGFQGKFNSIQSNSHLLNSKLELRKNKKSTIYFKVKVEEVFQNPRYIDFDYYHANLSSNVFVEISQNYKSMFLQYKVQN